MLKRNKILILIIFLFTSLFIYSCESKKVQKTYDQLTIISVNDTHGAIEPNKDHYGMAGLSWYVNEKRKEENTAVLVLSAGDMFQGSAISNYSKGLNMIEIMNDISFAAMTIGNHEFDWGLDTILNYVDGDLSNGEANFPFLGCNIIDKKTNAVPSLIKEYTVVDYDYFQVGIIGFIGTGLETDISASMVADYEFVDPVPIISELSEKLHNELGCELVIAMGHDNNTSTNSRIASLSGDHSVDMIINGHTHTVYTRTLTNGNGQRIPVVQAGTASEYLTDTKFAYDKETNTFDEGFSVTVNLSSWDIEADQEMLKKINQMVSAIEPIMGRVLGTAGSNVNRTSVSYWTADQIRENVTCDLAGINSGGIRASAFPINEGSNVTVKKLYEIMPFDNMIKTCELKGSDLLNVLIITDIVFSINYRKEGVNHYLNDELIDPNRVYVFACVDYLFDRDEEIYEKGENVVYTGLLMRDLMIQGVENLDKARWLDEYYG